MSDLTASDLPLAPAPNARAYLDRPTVHPAPLMGHRALLHRAAFYPVLVGQGPIVKARALRLSEPKGDRAGVTGNGTDLRLLVTGDSSAAGVGVTSQRQALTGQVVQRLSQRFRVDWRLIAKCGNTTPMTLAMLRRAKPARADVAVTGLGVNDITSGTSLRRWLAQTEELLDYLRDHVGVRRTYVSGLPPLSQFPLLPNPLRWSLGHQAERFDRALRDLLHDRAEARYITLDMALHDRNMAEDGYHPGPEVYAAWADVIADRLHANPPV